jgi:RNA polymerase sigma-70 factor, ECF subfamily
MSTHLAAVSHQGTPSRCRVREVDDKEHSRSSSFASLLEPHARALRAAACRLTAKTSEHEDLVQDTFERALRYLGGGRDCPHNMRAWLMSILHNTFIDRTRRAKAAYQPSDLIEDCPCPEQTEEPAWAAVSMDDIQQALATIEPDQRIAFELHYLRGLRYSEVASQLAIPGNTVASRLYRARRALQRALLPNEHAAPAY